MSAPVEPVNHVVLVTLPRHHGCWSIGGCGDGGVDVDLDGAAVHLQELSWVQFDFLVVFSSSFGPLLVVDHHPSDPFLLLSRFLPHLA